MLRLYTTRIKHMDRTTRELPTGLVFRKHQHYNFQYQSANFNWSFNQNIKLYSRSCCSPRVFCVGFLDLEKVRQDDLSDQSWPARPITDFCLVNFWTMFSCARWPMLLWFVSLRAGNWSAVRCHFICNFILKINSIIKCYPVGVRGSLYVDDVHSE